MIRRHSAMPFAAGMYAYPGGRVDPRDADAEVGWAGPSAADWAAVLQCDESRGARAGVRCRPRDVRGVRRPACRRGLATRSSPTRPATTGRCSGRRWSTGRCRSPTFSPARPRPAHRSAVRVGALDHAGVRAAALRHPLLRRGAAGRAARPGRLGRGRPGGLDAARRRRRRSRLGRDGDVAADVRDLDRAGRLQRASPTSSAAAPTRTHPDRDARASR